MAFANQEKNHKSLLVVVVAVTVVVAGVVAAARVEVAMVGVVTMAVVLVSPLTPLTLYRPSATVLFHFV